MANPRSIRYPGPRAEFHSMLMKELVSESPLQVTACLVGDEGDAISFPLLPLLAVSPLIAKTACHSYLYSSENIVIFLCGVSGNAIRKLLDYISLGEVEVGRNELGELGELALLLGLDMQAPGTANNTESDNDLGSVDSDVIFEPIIIKQEIFDDDEDALGHGHMLEGNMMEEYNGVELRLLPPPDPELQEIMHEEDEVPLLSNSTTNNVYKHCITCGQEFPFADDLATHIMGEHFVLGSINCPFCGKCFNRSGFPIHMRSHTGYRPNKCKVCGKCFITLSHLNRHEDTHTSIPSTSPPAPRIEPYKCNRCGEEFDARPELAAHVRMGRCEPDEAGQREFDCHICDKHFEHKQSLLIHMKSHNSQLYKCMYCQLTFHQQSALENHLATHTSPSVAYVVAQPDGDQLVQNAEQKPCSDDIVPTHPNGSYRCHLCSSRFQRRRELERHRQLVHGRYEAVAARPFKCQFCPRTFSGRSYLNSHQRSHSKNLVVSVQDEPVSETMKTEPKGMLQCRYCPRSFNGRNYLNSHEAAHEAAQRNETEAIPDGPPYQCRYCPRRFSARNYLNSHERAHKFQSMRPKALHGAYNAILGQYKCRFCPRRFNRRNYLNSHERSHRSQDSKQLKEPINKQIQQQLHVLSIPLMNAGPVQKTGPFKCRFCPKISNKRWNIQMHEQQHTGEKFYSCGHCDSKYASKPELNAHVKRQHAGKLCYLCRICQAEFNHKATYDAHLRTHEADGVRVPTPSPVKAENVQPEIKESVPVVANVVENVAQAEAGPPNPVTKPFKCDYCPNRYMNRSALRKHIRIHHAEGGSRIQVTFRNGQNTFTRKIKRTWKTASQGLPLIGPNRPTYSQETQPELASSEDISCRYCQKKFSTRSHVERHERLHTGLKPFACDICHARFTRKDNLNIHKSKHTSNNSVNQFIMPKPARPEGAHKCDFCPKSFDTNTLLTQHIRTHTGERPYPCSYCDKMFSHRSNQLRHMRAIHKLV